MSVTYFPHIERLRTIHQIIAFRKTDTSRHVRFINSRPDLAQRTDELDALSPFCNT